MKKVAKLVLMLCLTLSGVWIMAQGSSENSLEDLSGIYVKIAVPGISSSPYVMKEDVLQLGGAIEYKFRKKFGVNLEYDYRYRNYHNTLNESIRINSSHAIVPTFRYYMDEKSRFYLHVDAILAFCTYQASGVEYEIEPMEYWTNNIGFGLGYKVFLFKGKHFGLDLYVRQNLFVRNDSGLWGNNPITSHFDMGGWLFYRF